VSQYAVFETVLGWMGLGRRSQYVGVVMLPQSSRTLAEDRLRSSRWLEATYEEVEPYAFGSLAERLCRHMEGEYVPFDDPLDTSLWTEFRYRVWETTRLIPYGEVRSYGWLARSIGQEKASRAVGQALHNNPVPVIVPCHRVVGADGALVGFGGGCALKQRLIALEAGSQAVTSLDGK